MRSWASLIWTRRHRQGQAPQPHLRVGRGVDPSLLPGLAETWAAPGVTAAGEAVDVCCLIRMQEWTGEQPLVLVVAEDLQAPGCASVFGWADPAAQVAVVSTYALGQHGEILLRERLAKVIAHEWMHLAGRSHCRVAHCLMHPVASVKELDARGEALCERCRPAGPKDSSFSFKGFAAVVVFAAILFGGLDLTVSALNTKSRPFHAREEAGGAVVLYQAEEVLRVPVDGRLGEAAETAGKIAADLNRLFGAIDPPALAVRDVGQTAAVEAAGQPLFLVDAAMAGGDSPAVYARGWIARWRPLIEAKGRPHESCPDCHIRRRAQVREAVARPPRFWR